MSVLFVDLESFTASSDGADPEDVRDLLETYHAAARECIAQFGGTVEKFIGDAVMAVFGVPVSHGDDAERAVRAGLRVVARVESLGLSARAAVNTGEAVVRVADPVAGEPLAMGDVVNTASRLQSHAPAGHVLVGEATFRATRHAIRYERQPALDAKGKAEPVDAWLAVEPLPDSEEPSAVLAPFVGRRRELDLIRSVWEQAVSDRRPHLLTLLGSPGVGKSRLCLEVAAIVHADGGRVLRGRCLPYEELTGYQAFAQILRQVAGIFDSDSPVAARAKLEETARALFSTEEVTARTRELSLLLGLGGDDPVEDQRLLFFSARRLVELLGAEQPVLVVVEDIHLGAPSELDLFEYLAAHVRDTSAVFVALARSEFLDARPAWGGAAAQTRIPLEPLAVELAAEMAASLLPAGAGRDAVDRIVEVAEGNPLFIEELAAALDERVGTDELPVTVRAAIAARVDSLPASARTALMSAAVIGRTFWQDVLRAVAEFEDLETTLDDLERRDLIRREPTSRLEGDVQFRFKHALIREVAYGTLPRSARRERHAATARFIEARTDGAETVASILAHHWREAGEPEKAVPHLLAAGETAQRSWATEAATALYSLAIELAGDDATRAGIRLQRGIALVKLDEHAQALVDLEAVLPELEEQDRLDGLLYAGRAYLWTENQPETNRMAREAHALADRLDDDDGRAAATALLSQSLAMRGKPGDIERALELGDDALRRWRVGRREYERAEHLHLHADLTYWSGDYVRTTELASAAQALGGDIHSAEALLRGGGLHAVAATGLGRHEEALAIWDEMFGIARELERNPRVLLNYSSIVFRELYDLEEAKRRSEEALELSSEMTFSMPRSFARSDLIATDLLMGDVGSAQARWAESWEDAGRSSAWTSWLICGRLAVARAEIALHAEAPESALEWSGRATEIAAGTRRRKYEARARALLGRALLAGGRASEGLEQLRAAVVIADGLVNPPGRWSARADLVRALYASGDDEGAALVHAELVQIVQVFASTLSPERSAALLDAPAMRAVLEP